MIDSEPQSESDSGGLSKRNAAQDYEILPSQRAFGPVRSSHSCDASEPRLSASGGSASVRQPDHSPGPQHRHMESPRTSPFGGSVTGSFRAEEVSEGEAVSATDNEVGGARYSLRSQTAAAESVGPDRQCQPYVDTEEDDVDLEETGRVFTHGSTSAIPSKYRGASSVHQTGDPRPSPITLSGGGFDGVRFLPLPMSDAFLAIRDSRPPDSQPSLLFGLNIPWACLIERLTSTSAMKRSPPPQQQRQPRRSGRPRKSTQHPTPETHQRSSPARRRRGRPRKT